MGIRFIYVLIQNDTKSHTPFSNATRSEDDLDMIYFFLFLFLFFFNIEVVILTLQRNCVIHNNHFRERAFMYKKLKREDLLKYFQVREKTDAITNSGLYYIIYYTVYPRNSNSISRVERKTSVSQMVVFPQT